MKADLLDDDWEEDVPARKGSMKKRSEARTDPDEDDDLYDNDAEDIPEAEELGTEVPPDVADRRNVEEHEDHVIISGRSGKDNKGPKIKTIMVEEEEEDEFEEEPEEEDEFEEEPEEEGSTLDDDLLSSVEDVSDIVNGLEEEIAQQEDTHALKRDVPGILSDVISQAWEDGVITNDEMAMLQVLKKRFKVDDETFNAIMEDARPEGGEIQDETDEQADTSSIQDIMDAGSYHEVEEDDEEKLEEDAMEEGKEEYEEGFEDEEEEFEEEDMEEEDELGEGEKDKDDDDYEDDWDDDEDLEESVLSEDLGLDGLEDEAPKGMPPSQVSDAGMPTFSPPRSPSMITLTSSVRGRSPLGESFELKRKDEKVGQIRCPGCNNRITVQKGAKKCPICSATLSQAEDISEGDRALMNDARASIKKGDHISARHMLKQVLAGNPDNKEAQFFMRKVNATLSKGPKKEGAGTQVDLRNVANISTGVNRLDTLLNGGLPVGSQVMFKGPPFCGKEILYDQIMSSALKAGFPVIYVSTNRAMKDVIQGIVRYVPDFKEFNREGRIWMYDLFSKHDTKRVLKEGHRIFNIEIQEDFKKFREDLIFVQEEAVKMYGGGVMIINSLSPLISQTDINDLLKFLQMLIVRSKGYRFTNLVDIAHGIHDESVINSVEYLMEGIIEFRETDSRYHLRLRGFGQRIASRDWIEYNVTHGGLNLFGSFSEQRIV